MAEPRVVVLPLSQGKFRAGVSLLSYIAYPGADPRSELPRIEAERAIGFEALRREGPPSEVRVPPDYLAQSDAERRRLLRKIQTQLINRRAAARMARVLLSQTALKDLKDLAGLDQVVSRVVSRLPGGFKEQASASMARQQIIELVRSFYEELTQVQHEEGGRLTIEVLALRSRTDERGADAANVQGRSLRPSYPVLHVAVAVDLLLARLERQRDVRWSIYDLPRRSGFLEGVLRGGAEVAGLIGLTPKLRGAARQLIRFDLG
jgi:hypothetical protein